MRYEGAFYETNRYTAIVEADTEDEAAARLAELANGDIAQMVLEGRLVEDNDYYDFALVDVITIADQEQ